MDCLVKDIASWMNELAPISHKEEWDNVGLQIGDDTTPVKTIMVALTVTESVIAQAIKLNVDMIVAHHPLIFYPLLEVRWDGATGRHIAELCRHNINLYIAHTNYDAAAFGTSYLLAEALGLENHQVLHPLDGSIGTTGPIGLGRIGNLAEPITSKQFISLIYRVLEVPYIKCSGLAPAMVKKVAVLGGSGKGCLQSALLMKADVFLTGDIDFHTALEAWEQKVWLIDAGHFYTERLLIPYWIEYLTQKAKRNGFNLEVLAAHEDDPFVWHTKV